jgi:hypothetical protein
MQAVISQQYFDELCIDNYEVFEMSCTEDALNETISQLQGQNLAHLTLSYPDDNAGKIRGQIQRFRATLRSLEATNNHNELSQRGLESIRSNLQDEENRSLFTHLFTAEEGFDVYFKLFERLAANDDGEAAEILLTTLLELVPQSPSFLAAFQRAVRHSMPAMLSHFERIRIKQSDERLAGLIVSTVLTSVTRCEANKVLWMESCAEKRSFASVLLQTIRLAIVEAAEKPSIKLACAICRIMTALCTFDDFTTADDTSAPVVQSGHSHVQVFADAGAVSVLHAFLLHMESRHASDACAVVSTLRAMSIQDSVVQSLENAGVVESASRLLELTAVASEKKQMLATSLLGLFRNMAASDDIKATICTGRHSEVMKHAIEVIRLYPDVALLQEHGCGLFAAMALRKPKNATALVDAGTHVLIVGAMERHPHSVTLQRQAALALRNIVARSPELRPAILDCSAEEVLRDVAAKHLNCQDEVYAALRDLGVSTTSIHVHHSADGEVTIQKGRQMFGDRNPHFRQVYDESGL